MDPQYDRSNEKPPADKRVEDHERTFVLASDQLTRKFLLAHTIMETAEENNKGQ